MSGDAYVTITMDGPGKNAMSSDMFSLLQEALEDAGGRPVLLTGSGNAFSAGLNLVEVLETTEPAAMEDFLRRLDTTCQRLFDYPGPTVAHINGHAIAGGAILALCCDFRYATAHPRARAGLIEVPLGLVFPPMIMAIVKHRLPAHALREAVLVGELVSMQRAAELGIVDMVSDDAAALAEARITALAGYSQRAYAVAKAELQAGVTAIDAATQAAQYARALPEWMSPQVRAQLAKRIGR